MTDSFLSRDEAERMQDDAAAWEKFLHVLEWVLAVQMRYASNLRHSLVCIDFHDQTRLGQAYGSRGALEMLVDLAAHLRQSLRKTDLVARSGTTIWVMIPFVTPESVLSKVAQIVAIAAVDGLDIVDRDISIYSIPDAGILEGQDLSSAEDFLQFVADKKNVAIRWTGTSTFSP